MKSRTFVLIVGLLASSFTAGETFAGILDGLRAHYEFEGDATDSSGNNLHGTAYNNYSYETGVVGQSIRLVGQGHVGLAGGHVILPSIAFDTMDDFTIALWVRFQGHTTQHGESFIQYGRSTFNNSIYGMSYNIEAQRISYFAGGPWTSGISDVLTPMPADFTDNWHHLTLRVGNGVMTGFLNGQNVGSDTYTAPTSPLEGVAGLGAHWFNSGGTESNRFIGLIDDVRIYDRAIADSEVQQLAGGVVPEPSSIVLWAGIGLVGFFAIGRRRLRRDSCELDTA